MIFLPTQKLFAGFLMMRKKHWETEKVIFTQERKALKGEKNLHFLRHGLLNSTQLYLTGNIKFSLSVLWAHSQRQKNKIHFHKALFKENQDIYFSS